MMRRAVGYAAVCALGAVVCLGWLSTRRVDRALGWMERRLGV